MKNLNLEVARRCKEIRIKAGLTTKKFADDLGLKVEDIKEFESYTKTIPTKVLVEYVKLKKEGKDV